MMSIRSASLRPSAVPLTIAAFRTLDSRYWPEAMSVFHLLRNIGSSYVS